MSEIAKIAKDGVWSYKWDGNAREYIKRRSKYILTLLRCPCEIEEDVTLLDIFNAVDDIPELKEFISQYSWCGHIDEFHEDAIKTILPLEEKAKEPPLEYLEIRWHAETHHYKGKRSIDITPDFHGVGEDRERPDRPKGEKQLTSYSVSYSPMWELAHLPVKLNHIVDIFDPKMREGKQKLIFQGEREFTLLEVLDAIYDDISFMGGPDDNARFLEEMKETTEKIKSGEVECVPWEEITKGAEEQEPETDQQNN